MAAIKQVFIKISQQDLFRKYENNKLLERLSCLRQDCGSKGDEGLAYQTDGVGQVQPGHLSERCHWELRIHSNTNSPFCSRWYNTAVHRQIVVDPPVQQVGNNATKATTVVAVKHLSECLNERLMVFTRDCPVFDLRASSTCLTLKEIIL